MAMFKTIKVSHREFGDVKVKVDAEDAEILKNQNLYIKIDNTTATEYHPRVCLYAAGGLVAYAHRFVLEKNKLLEKGRNYKPKNGDWFDLRKKNFI
jgi:hypothetical protein